jgi:hypothetical protein
MDLSGAEWRKASYSGSNGGNCVEVARNLPGIVAIRDSKEPNRPPLVFTVTEWDAFIRGAKDGEFDAESGDWVAP